MFCEQYIYDKEDPLCSSRAMLVLPLENYRMNTLSSRSDYNTIKNLSVRFYLNLIVIRSERNYLLAEIMRSSSSKFNDSPLLPLLTYNAYRLKQADYEDDPFLTPLRFLRDHRDLI